MSLVRRGKPRPPSRRPVRPPLPVDRALRESILRWYLRNRRDLPWRETRDAYAIWVSEIMLQQTRVETVIPFYRRFLERFPDVDRLARAKPEEVLAAWSGLGYYGRARNLREAARIVVREHSGRVPEETDLLRRLPGIGAYTAAAISSVAFGRPAAAVDGNVVRVLARIGGLRGRRNDEALIRKIMPRAEALAAGRRPGDWTQALMELGATVCLPGSPRCDRCPASDRCRARQSGNPERYPEPARAASARSERRVMLLVRRRGRILLVSDPKSEQEEWSLPSAPCGGDGGRAAARRLAAALGHGRAPAPEGPVHTFRHRTFSTDLHCEVWKLDVAPPMRAAPHRRWIVPSDVDRLPVRSPTLKAIRKLARN